MPRWARRIRCPGIMHPSSGSLSPGTSHAMLSAPTASTCLSASQYEALAAMPGPDEHHFAGLDVYALLLAAVLQILRRDGVAWLELIGALARGHVEEDSGGRYRRYLLDAESLEAARALDAAVHGDVAEERQGIRLMAKRVDVGPCVLSADDDAGGPSARPCFFGPVLVFVAAVEGVRVAGLPLGGGDGDAFPAGVLPV